MQGNRARESSACDFRGLEARPVHTVDHATEEELLSDEDSEFRGRTFEVGASGSSEVCAEGAFQLGRIDDRPEAVCADPEGFAAEVGPASNGSDRIEVAMGEFLADGVGQANPARDPLDRAVRIDPEELRSKGRGSKVEALGLDRGEGFCPRQRRMLSREFDEGAHGLVQRRGDG